MYTEYYCRVCGMHFFREALPNLNHRHNRCGAVAKVVGHHPKDPMPQVRSRKKDLPKTQTS